MKQLRLIFLGAFFLITNPAIFGQVKQAEESNEPALLRATEVISQSLNATGFNHTDNLPKSYHLLFKITRRTSDNLEYDYEEAFSAGFPNKLRTYSYDNKLYTFLSMLDNTQYYKDYVSTGANPTTESRNVTLNSDEQSKDHDVRLLKRNAFEVFFPLLFEASWYPKIQFKHVGIAESPEGNADVLESITKNGTKHQLLFDVKSHYLLFWKIVRPTTEGKNNEQILYFSDYKKIGNYHIAHQVTFYENGTLDETRNLKSFSDDEKYIQGLFEGKK